MPFEFHADKDSFLTYEGDDTYVQFTPAKPEQLPSMHEGVCGDTEGRVRMRWTQSLVCFVYANLDSCVGIKVPRSGSFDVTLQQWLDACADSKKNAYATFVKALELRDGSVSVDTSRDNAHAYHHGVRIRKSHDAEHLDFELYLDANYLASWTGTFDTLYDFSRNVGDVFESHLRVMQDTRYPVQIAPMREAVRRLMSQ